ncbi:MAG: helix-turn-helix domain-containing protein [Euryarchaeota archaeon]|nr:helix-turn-helix domain-containing protein [Euryarchaeota archaeon]
MPSDVRSLLAEKIAGEITLSPNPGETIKKWRKNFEISQVDMAQSLTVTASVVSDYESGRRKSPGTALVGRFVNALLDIDQKRGGKKIEAYESILRDSPISEVIFDMREYAAPILLRDFQKLIEGECLTEPLPGKTINGYTIIDSLKAILKLSTTEFSKLYGWSTERALIFTGVSTGKSPLIAIRVTNLKPGAVILHGIAGKDVDPLAVKIAQIEHLPLLSTTLPVARLVDLLRS